MKRVLAVALGAALGGFTSAAMAAAPNHIWTSDNPGFTSEPRGDDYAEPRSRGRSASRRSSRNAGTRTGRRQASHRSGRRQAERSGPSNSVSARSFTRYASPGTSRGCLTPSARALLGRIEAHFGRVQVVSTCRPGARIAGTGRISRHASGNAVDFNAPSGRKAAIVRWLVANHRSGGTMTYAGMSHIHVDIGYHFVSLNSGGRRH